MTLMVCGRGRLSMAGIAELGPGHVKLAAMMGLGSCGAGTRDDALGCGEGEGRGE